MTPHSKQDQQDIGKSALGNIDQFFGEGHRKPVVEGQHVLEQLSFQLLRDFLKKNDGCRLSKTQQLSKQNKSTIVFFKII